MGFTSGHGEQSTLGGTESDMNSNHKPVAVVVGATSKWQADGRNTKLALGQGKALSLSI